MLYQCTGDKEAAALNFNTIVSNVKKYYSHFLSLSSVHLNLHDMLVMCENRLVSDSCQVSVCKQTGEWLKPSVIQYKDSIEWVCV